MANQSSICVVMATYNPNPEYLAKQVESIRAQTHSNWTCLINDDHSSAEHFRQINEIVAGDSRFRVSRNSKRLGVYHNFEAALREVPATTDLVALADQDDIWIPEKLHVMGKAFATDPNVILAHSDLSIIDDHDRVVLPSCWKLERRNVANADSLSLLLMKNVITGCATVFRRHLLDSALPFPPQPTIPFFYHDLWLGLIASAHGKIVALHEPLVRYRKHSHNTLGPMRNGVVPALQKLWKTPARYFRSDFVRTKLAAMQESWEGRQALSSALEQRLLETKLPGGHLRRSGPYLFNETFDLGGLTLLLLFYSVLRRHRPISLALTLFGGKLRHDITSVSALSSDWLSPKRDHSK